MEPYEETASRVSAWVWATFPVGPVGRIVRFVFVHVLDGIAKDRLHARTELQYLKGLIEDSGRQAGR